MKRWKTDRLARRCLVAAALALLVGAFTAGRPGSGNAESPTPAPGSFSRAKLERVGDYIRNEIATGKIPGAIMLIQQHGQPVYFENFGVRDAATRLPMTADTIFRLYSMSKPITSVAAMMLVEEGRLKLDDPVSKYIPAFADVKVGVEKPGEQPALVLEPLSRPITIEDLLRHTSGLTYGFYGDSAVCGSFTQRLISSIEIPTMPNSSSALQNCRSPSSRERCGITAIRPMCSVA
jgi:CubicO group peptidase (beta-lactamase class C family)